MSDPHGETPGPGTDVALAGAGDATRLRELTDRLRQVHQRTTPRGPASPSVELARRRLADLVEDVETCLLSGVAPPPPGDLELQLATVEQLFESSGDPKTARVLAGVRESLARPTAEETGLEPPPPRRFEPPPAPRFELPPRRRRARPLSDVTGEPWETMARPASGWRWWLGVAVLGLLAIVAVLASRVSTGDRREPVAPATQAGASPPAEARPRAAPSPAVPTVSWSSLADEADAYEDRLERVKVETAEGWRAIRSGDLEAAVSCLAAAAALDRHHRMVRELAQGIVEALVAAAADDADHGRWTEAPERLHEARALAERLSLDTAVIDAAEETLAAARRFDYVLPGERAAVARAVGRDVRVTVAGAPALDGRLTAFSRDVLHLEVSSGVPGGEVAFTTEIPLTRVLELRVFHDVD